MVLVFSHFQEDGDQFTVPQSAIKNLNTADWGDEQKEKGVLSKDAEVFRTRMLL